MPLNVAPSGKAASAAPVTPAADWAAAGIGARRPASLSIAASTSPSRVISVPPGPLFVNLDVTTADRAAIRRIHVTAVRDLELVQILARVSVVLDVGREAHSASRVCRRA